MPSYKKDANPNTQQTLDAQNVASLNRALPYTKTFNALQEVAFKQLRTASATKVFAAEYNLLRFKETAPGYDPDAYPSLLRYAVKKRGVSCV
jgi:hypothetical protein